MSDEKGAVVAANHACHACATQIELLQGISKKVEMILELLMQNSAAAAMDKPQTISTPNKEDTDTSYTDPEDEESMLLAFVRP